MFWTRLYFALPLEVSHPRSQAYNQAKRFYREEKTKEDEITDLNHPVFAGQIFAEMLGAICHPEFYEYTNQEVPASRPINAD